MAITLEDIAKRAGVTQAAVSEIVRNHPNAKRFRKETRDRVMKVAQQLNYRPHFFASQIRAENRKLGMLCVSSLNDFFASEVAQAFESVLSAKGYNLLVNSLVNKSDGNFYDGILGPQGIMALALVGNISKRHFPDSRLAALVKQKVKVVTVGRETPVKGITQILFEEDHGVRLVIDHLLERNPRRIWLLGKPEAKCKEDDGGDFCMRLNVAADYLQEHAPDVEVQRHDVQMPAANAERVIREALAGGERPDAIFCATDWLGWGALKALAEAGIQPGPEVAVAGYNNDLFSQYTLPGLTTVNAPGSALGERAGKALIAMYEGDVEPGSVFSLPAELVVRGSSLGKDA